MSYGIVGVVIYIMDPFLDYRTWLQVFLISIMSMVVFVEVVHLGRMTRDPFLVVE